MSFANAKARYAGLIDLTLQKARYSLRRRFSHSNEEQILKHYIDQLVPKDRPRTVVDIGAGNGVRWSNSYALVMEGWNAVGIEVDQQKHALLEQVYADFPNARACNNRVQAETINSLLESLAIPVDFSVLCLDVDGNDYWILNSILSKFRPRLVVTEINEKIPPPIRFAIKYDPNFRLRHHFYGYSIAALEDLCARYDYGILRLEYNNAFIAPRELTTEFLDAASAYDEGYRNRTDRSERFHLNFDIDEVLKLAPQEAIEFLRNFYSKDEGNYYLSLNAGAIPAIPEKARSLKSAGVSCPICRSPQKPRQLAIASLGDETNFDLVECQECQTRHLSPLPSIDQLKEFYEPHYYGIDWYKQRGLGRALAELKLNKMPAGNFLDIGCGLGFFLDGINSNSEWRVYGVELAAPAVEFAREELGLEVSSGEMTELDYPDDFFDYIQMHNVLEHVLDPMCLLKECCRVLKPSGKLHLRVPNGQVDSHYLVKFFQEQHQAPFSKSGHLFFFPKTTLIWMFENAGLKIEDARTYGIRRGLATFGFWPQLKNWRRHYSSKPLFDNRRPRQIVLPPEKNRPQLYYRYRMARMNARMLRGIRDYGLDFQFVLSRK